MADDSDDSSKPRPPRTVRCPSCGRPATFDQSNPFRPFCSERCRINDLGAWAEERYAVPANEPPEGFADEESSAEGDDPLKH